MGDLPKSNSSSSSSSGSSSSSSQSNPSSSSSDSSSSPASSSVRRMRLLQSSGDDKKKPGKLKKMLDDLKNKLKKGAKKLGDKIKAKFAKKKNPPAYKVPEEAKKDKKPPKKLNFDPNPKFITLPSMPSLTTNLMQVIFTILGTIWRVFYWLSWILIIFFDLWSVRWQDWGVLRFGRNFNAQKQLRVEREPIISQTTDKATDKNRNSVNMTPLLLFHASYFLISFLGVMDVNFRPVVSQSNIGLHNAVHHNYFFLLPENHLLEKKYVV